MTRPEIAQILRKLTLAFPALAMDSPRCGEIARKIEGFDFDVGARAADDYVDHGEDKFFELTRFLAIAYRLSREKSEREAMIKRTLDGRRSASEFQAMRQREAKAEQLIAEMTDDDVRAEWQPLLEQMVGLPREWAEKWPVEKIRANVRFKRKIIGLMET